MHLQFGYFIGTNIRTFRMKLSRTPGQGFSNTEVGSLPNNSLRLSFPRYELS